MKSAEKTNFLSNLKNFIEEQKTWLQNTLNSVGWDVSDLKKSAEFADPELVPCSVVPEHRIPPASVLKHEEICEKRNGQYPKDIDSLSIEFGGYAVIMNYFRWIINEKKHALLIDNFNADVNLTDEEESQNAKKRNQQKESSAKYLMELLAAERDAKRRRAAHRGKRVHSNKKSYNEILSEVISSQMETLIESDSIDIESASGKAESTPKNVIQPRVDCYLGVGSKCFNGNPHKRWMFIKDEERELINEMKTENLPDKNTRHRKNSYETHKTYDKSTHDYKYDKKDYHTSHRKDRERDFERFKYDRDFDDSRKERTHRSSRCDERYPEKHSDKEYSYRKRHHDSDSHESHSKHRKKRRKRSLERSSHKKSCHKSRHRDSKDK